MTTTCLIKAVMMFDPESHIAEPPAADSDLIESKLLYYHGFTQEEQERRNECNLVHGVADFALFCNMGKNPDDEMVTIETENSLFLVTKFEKSVRLCLVFAKESISPFSASLLIQRFIDLFLLLHGNLTPISSSMDDFVSFFVAAECSTAKSTQPAIRYAPVERHALVATHSLGLELVHEFKNQISHFAICYKGSLISSSLEPHLLTPLYTYLVMDSHSGSVSNSKLLNSPYGRINSPAVVAGGGSSAFGRCNFFDPDNSSNGFLFGPTGGGSSVFCPEINLRDNSSHFLCVYVINNFMIVVLLSNLNNFELFKSIELFFTENSAFNDEIIPLVRSDFAKSANSSPNFAFDFTYRNLVNKSLIASDRNTFSEHNRREKKPSFFSRSFLYPFTDRFASGSPDTLGFEDLVKCKIADVAKKFNDISNISVKKSTNDGWRVLKRSGPFREVDFHFNDPKTPLWKINTEIQYVLRHKFDSIFL